LLGLKGGEKVTARDLLYGILYRSGAECCLTMAGKVSGSEQKFVKLMNEKAKEIGMAHTSFGNCIGLEKPACFTTVSDMSKLLCYALKNKTFREIYASDYYVIKPTNKSKTARIIKNRAVELFGADRAGVIGGKTGYTPAAEFCLTTIAKIGKREYICISAHAVKRKGHLLPQVDDARTVYRAIKARIAHLKYL